MRARTRTRQVFFVFCLHRFTRWVQCIDQQCFVGEGFDEAPSPSGEDRGNAKAFTPNIQQFNRLQVRGEGKKVETC